MQCRDRSGDQREAPGRYHTPKDLLEKVGGRDSNICRFPDIGNSGVYGITRTSHWWCGTAHQEVFWTSHGWSKGLGRPQGRPKHTPCPPKAAPSIMESCEDNLHQARKIISCMCGFLKAPRKRRQVEWSLVSFPDVETLKTGNGASLRLEDEVRSRVVMKLALYHVPSKPKMMRMPDRKCPCCLTETPSFIALCILLLGGFNLFKKSQSNWNISSSIGVKNHHHLIQKITLGVPSVLSSYITDTDMGGHAALYVVNVASSLKTGLPGGSSQWM